VKIPWNFYFELFFTILVEMFFGQTFFGFDQNFFDFDQNFFGFDQKFFGFGYFFIDN